MRLSQGVLEPALVHRVLGSAVGQKVLESGLRICAFRGGRCVHPEEERRRRCAAARRAHQERRAGEPLTESAPEDHPRPEWREDWY